MNRERERISVLYQQSFAGYRNIQASGKKALEHEGIAIREYHIINEAEWYSEKEQWKGLKSFGMVYKKIKKANGSEEEERRYCICSIEEDSEAFARAARGHLGVENDLHWQLDFTFQDDKTQAWRRREEKNSRS